MQFPKWFTNIAEMLFSNLYLVLGVLVLIVIVCILLIFYLRVVKGRKGRVLYFDELEGGGEELDVTLITAKSLKTNSYPIKTFLRTPIARVYNFRKRIGSIPTWIGKRGTAYLFKPASTPEDKAVKVGSFYDGLITLLTDAQKDAMDEELKKKLQESEMFITVDIEEGFTPEGLPEMSEDYVTSDADDQMANLFGRAMKETLGSGKEDVIKIALAMGCGVGLTYALQAMGILGSF